MLISQVYRDTDGGVSAPFCRLHTRLLLSKHYGACSLCELNTLPFLQTQKNVGGAFFPHPKGCSFTRHITYAFVKVNTLHLSQVINLRYARTRLFLVWLRHKSKGNRVFSVSRHCGASHLRARPLRLFGVPPTIASRRRRSAAFALTCHKPRCRSRVKPCAFAPLPSSLFAAVRLLLSCLVSRSLSFGGTPVRPHSASVPLAFGTPVVPPSPHFSPFVLLRGGRLVGFAVSLQSVAHRSR